MTTTATIEPPLLRLVEPEDFTDEKTIRYQARLAWLAMRDKPLVYSRDTTIVIEPAMTEDNTIHWLGSDRPLDYHDASVNITKKKSKLIINYSAESSAQAKRGIHAAALDCAEHIYAHDYARHYALTQDMLRTYASIGAAMTAEFPQNHQFLTYGARPNVKHETFALHTPGVSDARYRATSQIVIQKSNHLVKRIWTAERTHISDNDYADTHDTTATQVMDMRNKLERFGWRHTTHSATHIGITAPLNWQNIDTIMNDQNH